MTDPEVRQVAEPAQRVPSRGHEPTTAISRAREARALPATARPRRRLGPRSAVATAGLIVLLVMLAMSAVPGLFAGLDPEATRPQVRLRPPSGENIMGTDYLGRDVFARIVHGSRFSLLPSFLVVMVAGALGSVAGLVAGYVGGWFDEAVMRFTDVFLGVPALILAMAIATALGPSVLNAALSVILVWWPGYARLVRSETQVLRAAEYVQAATVLGASHPRIIFGHIFPNLASSLIVKASLDVGTVLLILSGLGFLGVGAQPLTPEWGLEVASARQYMFDSPWYVFAPGLAIFAAVYSMNVVGDAVRERLDPRLRDG